VKKLPKPAALAIIVGVLLVVAAAGYFLLISPKRSDVNALNAEIEAAQAQIDATRTARRQALQVEPIRVADLFRVAKAMPDTADMPGVLLELNRIARDTGIRFESITSSQDATDAGGYLRQPVDLVFDGNFYELSDFLYRVRSLVSVRGGKLDATGRLFGVRAFSFVESQRGFPEIKATLTVDAYVYGTGAPTAAAQPGGTAPPPAQPAPPAAPSPPPPPAATAAGAS
jgi:hypothetical protein